MAGVVRLLSQSTVPVVWMEMAQLVLRTGVIPRCANWSCGTVNRLACDESVLAGELAAAGLVSRQALRSNSGSRAPSGQTQVRRSEGILSYCWIIAGEGHPRPAHGGFEPAHKK